METVEAWHFVSADRHTRYTPRVVIETGQTLTHPGKLELCESGFHASVRALDALQFAPGPIICRVRMGGEMLRANDKLVAQSRTVLWMADATNALHEMACVSAASALLIAEVDDPRCWAAIEAKRAWLRGEISDQKLAAARDAAREAAWEAAREAAWEAAWEAASAAAWDEQNYVFEKLLMELAP